LFQEYARFHDAFFVQSSFWEVNVTEGLIIQVGHI